MVLLLVKTRLKALPINIIKIVKIIGFNKYTTPNLHSFVKIICTIVLIFINRFANI